MWEFFGRSTGTLVAKAILLGVAGKSFTLQAFIAGGLIDSIPGILLQFILIPAIIKLINIKSEMAK